MSAGVKYDSIIEMNENKKGGAFSVDILLKNRLRNKVSMVRQTQEGGGWFEGSWFSFNTITTIAKDVLAIIGAWITEFFLEIFIILLSIKATIAQITVKKLIVK
jgi:hypothetical protein